ncbi:MAG TPA: Crp/Fnr family transcriptional regulator [Thermoanaerobacterales bacterium]|nr:Crp/Fnr family transcriptional regulator [Thermoanaerobacterales bacterium]
MQTHCPAGKMGSIETFKNTSPWLKICLETWEPLLSKEYLISYPTSTVIKRQGDISESVYIVKSGRVMMRSLSREGKEKIIMFAEKGGLFGEEGLFEGMTIPYSAIAIVDCQLYRIPIKHFFEVISTNSKISFAVMTVLSRKTYLYVSQVLGLSFGDIRYRIAGVLIYLISMYGQPATNGVLIDLPFTHQDMADLIKSSRVSVSKIFREFTDMGIIKKEKGRYIICDLQQLENIVNKV